jgi:2-polyprenyl-6-methoxyphenol hydroxylase-like FAD-dependent oxidoreductase
MSDQRQILIAGAGIGGLTAALCLARAGFKVKLLERAKLLQEVGAGLQISPNASVILRELGVLPRLIRAGLVPDAVAMRRSHDGALLTRLPLDDAESRWGAPYLLVHRADLQKALIETVAEHPDISLDMQTEVIGFAETAGGLDVNLRQDGRDTHIGAHALIGADGLRSQLRQKLFDDLNSVAQGFALPDCAHQIAWRTLVEADSVEPELRRKEATLWLGPKSHLVHYPLRGGTVINVVAVVETSVAIDWNADIWSQEGDAAEIAAHFAPWHRDARKLIERARAWRRWPLVQLPPLPHWSRGRVALLGDAAHPMLPFLAQGAAQAIEDAAALAVSIRKNPQIEQALVAYELVRKSRASRVQRQSNRQATIYHLTGPTTFFRDLALRSMSPRQLLARYDWVYRARPPSK